MRIEYLNETLLGIFLEERIHNNFKHDKVLDNSNIRGRYDYIFYNEKLIVEFDGFRHFNTSKQILADKRKDIIANQMGYNLIRIPYFIQLDSEVIEYYFKEVLNDYTVFNNYPHGFMDSKAMLPADYCELGQIEFTNFIKQTEGTNFNKSIKNNLKDLLTKNDPRIVVYSDLISYL